MRFAIIAAGLLSAASTALAGTALIDNYCDEQIFLTITRSDQSTTNFTLALGESHSEELAGSGNSFGVILSPDYFSPDTPKLIWGYSVAGDLAYWTVSDVDGDPFYDQSWAITATDPTCSQADTYDGEVHTCETTADLILSLCE